MPRCGWLSVADVERLIVHQQTHQLAVGDVDDGLPRLGVAVVAGFGVGQRTHLVDPVQVRAGQPMRLALIKFSPPSDVTVRQGENRLGLRQHIQIEGRLSHAPRLDRVGGMGNHVRPITRPRSPKLWTDALRYCVIEDRLLAVVLGVDDLVDRGEATGTTPGPPLWPALLHAGPSAGGATSPLTPRSERPGSVPQSPTARALTSGCGRPRPSRRDRRTRCGPRVECCRNLTSARRPGRCATRPRAGCCWTACCGTGPVSPRVPHR